MSYCRWSSMNWKCDLYCYESSDGYTTHVAGNRTVGEVPKVDFNLLTPGGDTKLFAEQYKAQMDWLSSAERKPIGLPHDGETFHDPDLLSFLVRVTSLREWGYNVPQHVFDAIHEELEEAHKYDL